MDEAFTTWQLQVDVCSDYEQSLSKEGFTLSAHCKGIQVIVLRLINSDEKTVVQLPLIVVLPGMKLLETYLQHKSQPNWVQRCRVAAAYMQLVCMVDRVMMSH